MLHFIMLSINLNWHFTLDMSHDTSVKYYQNMNDCKTKRKHEIQLEKQQRETLNMSPKAIGIHFHHQFNNDYMHPYKYLLTFFVFVVVQESIIFIQIYTNRYLLVCPSVRLSVCPYFSVIVCLWSFIHSLEATIENKWNLYGRRVNIQVHVIFLLPTISEKKDIKNF